MGRAFFAFVGRLRDVYAEGVFSWGSFWGWVGFNGGALEDHDKTEGIKMGANDNHVVDEFLKDEEKFLARATLGEIKRLIKYFNIRAFQAQTPQEHEFFTERAAQV